MKTVALQRLRQKLAQGQPVFGLWVTLESASVTEMAVALGLDWVVIDAEHGHLDWKEILEHVRATVRSDTVALVRLAELNGGLIKRALDVGADGVVIPWIESAEQLRQAVAFARYPPAGRRGIGAERATGWGQCLPQHVQEADAHGVTTSIDVLVPVVNFIDDKPGNSQFAGDQRPAYDAFLAGSPRREVWGYQSCMSHGCGGTVNMGSPSDSDRYFTGWPSYMIDASAVRNRAMQWLDFKYRLSGELYYETAMAYTHDPWTNQWDFTGNGDGTLFYPGTPARIGGTTHIPVASIRLAMIREGMEDYEYLALLSRSGGDADARAIADRLFPNAYSTEIDPAALMAAREEIASRIVALGATGSATTALSGGTPAGAPGGAPSAGGCSAGRSGAGSLLAPLAAVLAMRLRRRRGAAH